MVFSPDIKNRAKILEEGGLDTLDSYHLACAESANADLLLTADEDFERKGSAINSKTRVINPVKFLEVRNDYNS